MADGAALEVKCISQTYQIMSTDVIRYSQQMLQAAGLTNLLLGWKVKDEAGQGFLKAESRKKVCRGLFWSHMLDVASDVNKAFTALSH